MIDTSIVMGCDGCTDRLHIGSAGLSVSINEERAETLGGDVFELPPTWTLSAQRDLPTFPPHGWMLRSKDGALTLLCPACG